MSKKLEIGKTAEISNNHEIKIANTGSEGFTMNGKVKNSGSTALTNWAGDFIIDGTIENSSTTNIWSVKGDLDVNGVVNNKNGKLTITNDGNALNIGENALISNDAATVITNTGNGGLNHNGAVIQSGANLIVDNKAGDKITANYLIIIILNPGLIKIPRKGLEKIQFRFKLSMGDQR